MYIVFLQKKEMSKRLGLLTFTEDECGFVPSVFGFKGIYITDKICKQWDHEKSEKIFSYQQLGDF